MTEIETEAATDTAPSPMASNKATAQLEPAANPLQRYLARFGLTWAVFLAMPMIFIVMNMVVGAMTPDYRCPICPPKHPLAEVPAGLGKEAHAKATVEVWVEHAEKNLPTLTREPPIFAWDPTAKIPDDKRRLIAQIAADDLSARYSYGVPTALLILLSVPLTFVVIFALPPPPSYWRYAGGFVIGVGICAGVVLADSHPIRVLSAEYLLGKAALDPYGFLTPETWMVTFRVVAGVTAAGMTATGILIVLFGWLASGPGPHDEPLTTDQLAKRTRLFKLAMGLGSAVLILSVASGHGLFQWAPVLLEPGQRRVMESLGSSAALFWGVVYSMTLLAVSAPSAIRLQREIARAAGSPMPAAKGKSAAQLAEDIGFDFNLRRSLSAVMTLAAPLLTGPTLDLVRHIATG
ncbi:MAG: hypothetical protein AAF674_19045 [Pseudomonadota bacterium]